MLPVGWAGNLHRDATRTAGTTSGPCSPSAMFRRAIAGISIALLWVSSACALDFIAVPGGRIAVELSGATAMFDRAAFMDWVRSSAEAVATYYGRFPAEETRLVVTIRPGHGISNGRTWAHDGGLIRIRVGAATTPEDYARDWVLVHEMTHLALPSLPDAQGWLEEGLATYVEPLARAQAGRLDPESAWLSAVSGMPNGLPKAGDRGLDHTHTWGRTYWGGALFGLLADVEIRRRTGNRRGLQDALRAILAHGNMETSSDAATLFAIGDRAVGVPVLEELYALHKDTPVATDLDALWRRLGVVREGGSIRFDDSARDVAIRRAMTTPP